MSVILILIIASLLMATTFLLGFIWCVRSGQYEDTTTPSMRVLMEEGTSPISAELTRKDETLAMAGVSPLAPLPLPECIGNKAHNEEQPRQTSSPISRQKSDFTTS
jgi:cbb3-type cytochrome oxidase maturation protein